MSVSPVQRIGLRLSIRAKLSMVLVALGATIVGSSLTTLTFSTAERARLAAADQRMTQLSQVLLPLRNEARDLQVDVIQVQQFLTDAAATHHEDSFEDAGKYARDFPLRSQTLKGLLARLPQSPEIVRTVETLAGLDKRFEAFDATGVAMAHVYIDKGVEAGNVEMETFDKMSEDLFGELNGFLKNVAESVDAATAGASQAIVETGAASARMMYWVAALGALGLLVTAGAVWTVGAHVSAPLARLFAAVAALSGNEDANVADCDRGDEIGALARALAEMRDNRVASRRRDEEASHQREAMQAAREAEGRRREAASREQGEAFDRLASGLRALSDGDLGQTLADGFAEPYRPIRDDFNAAAGDLSRLIGAVVDAINTIEAGSRQMSAASSDLAGRAESHATALEESASAMAEFTRALGDTAEASTRTKDVISVAKADMQANAQVISATVEAIGRIKASSEQIRDILGVIDEIAFQTNLLALNAGVEAARAGDAGRGFAVVASEVRALAQRSAGAAREINALISGSVGHVEHGFSLVKTTGAIFERTRQSVFQIDDGIAAIADRAVLQSQTLKQMNASIAEIDRGTQQNAAMAEQASAACRSLTAECARLQDMVARFRLRDEGPHDQRRAA